ncbi:MAG: methyltransferase domain-containing protein [Pseudomonadota bacterium]
MSGLDKVYDLTSPELAKGYYDDWATGYDEELTRNQYATPVRCAEALAAHAALPWAPVLELGCGTGLGGIALQAAGFECIDGVDISGNMLAEAEAKEIYRSLVPMDLSQPLDEIDPATYQNIAAIGVLNPAHLPMTLIDEALSKLPSGGCFCFSVNDIAANDGQAETRVLELTEHMVADLVFKEHGKHLPDIDLSSTVYVLKRR